VRVRPFAWDVLIAAGLALPVLLVALRGVPGPSRAAFVFGPGDASYLSGFAPQHEIENEVASHWSRHEAAVRLPLTLTGPASLRFRYARVLREPGQVVVSLAGTALESFPVRGGGRPSERRIALAGTTPVPLDVGFDVAAGDTRDYGLKLYWLAVETGAGGRLGLAGSARFRASLLAALLFLALRWFGWERAGALLLTLPLVVAASLGLARDPWLVHRLLTGLPETFVLAAAALLLANRLWGAGLSTVDRRRIAALACATVLLRVAALNHPAFHYPDLMTHERLSAAIHEDGLAFARHPAQVIGGQGAWSKPTFAGTVVMPYAAAFHLPFAVLALSPDARIQAFKLFAACVTVIPLLALVALARRFGGSLAGPALVVVIPIYASRLSLALFPALLGHALDMLLLAWLAWHLERLREVRVWMVGALLVAAAQVAYVSSITHTALLVVALALLLAVVERGAAGRADALRVLAMGLAGATLAVALYYRDFLDSAVALAAGGGGSSQYPVSGFWEVARNRTWTFFGFAYLPLALVGAPALRRQGRATLLLVAWLATYVALLLLRAKAPDLFRYAHEPLFLTPLVCLGAGEGLRRLWARGGLPRAVAAAAAAWLVVAGLRDQWAALAAQLLSSPPGL
jgi:hypothetical protein